MIYTNLKFDPCINFDLEFLELLNCAIVAFISFLKNTHSTTIISKKCCVEFNFTVFMWFYSTVTDFDSFIIWPITSKLTSLC